MNLTLKKIVNLALSLIITDLLLSEGLKYLEKEHPSIRRLRIICRKLKRYH